MFVSRYRSVLVSVLALMTIFLASCGDRPTAQAPTYTPVALEQIEFHTARVSVMRERMSELERLIQAKDWTNVENFIHGPLGTLRQEISSINRNLLPESQRQGRQIARDLFRDLEEISLAAKERSFAQIAQNYPESLADFDEFLSLLPQAETER
ncbi:MAG: photosystem II protein PsbQ [Cyanobacteria bacterium SID2]|nr:photosystem II protein PsbQ [Cyanobacteria bacterium SID2]MBP0006789.1 photosystem II protein PsbQ [Cyanobacteria bacterium SBC]